MYEANILDAEQQQKQNLHTKIAFAITTTTATTTITTNKASNSTTLTHKNNNNKAIFYPSVISFSTLIPQKTLEGK